jgi:hypothetical protein
VDSRTLYTPSGESLQDDKLFRVLLHLCEDALDLGWQVWAEPNTEPEQLVDPLTNFGFEIL